MLLLSLLKRVIVMVANSVRVEIGVCSATTMKQVKQKVGGGGTRNENTISKHSKRKKENKQKQKHGKRKTNKNKSQKAQNTN